MFTSVTAQTHHACTNTTARSVHVCDCTDTPCMYQHIGLSAWTDGAGLGACSLGDTNDDRPGLDSIRRPISIHYGRNAVWNERCVKSADKKGTGLLAVQSLSVSVPTAALWSQRRPPISNEPNKESQWGVGWEGGGAWGGGGLSLIHI